GLERAARVVRNHRIWELYLTRRLDIAADHVHRDAEDMEHALDDAVLEAIDQALGRPTVDPHGRPIPRGVPA
ncbi:MAG: metal-dependent transcriptional regulator, partial [Planctomycetota bacterium]